MERGVDYLRLCACSFVAGAGWRGWRGWVLEAIGLSTME